MDIKPITRKYVCEYYCVGSRIERESYKEGDLFTSRGAVKI